ncbi:MAG: tRNA pseudouridine(38-40) synthase TruA [candidate division Zixibacteria bacterium]|nr:tRNA pseudouridine(38-40) synthase TruA [candidate division Zixibacteria bacterium]
MAQKNIKLLIEYDGTAYAGWQVQKNLNSVQGELIKAIESVTRRRVTLIGAGRTDAGVHALGQVANFVVDHDLEPVRFKDAINFYLPSDIRIRESSEAAADFDARRDARWKRYRYLVGLQKSAVYRQLRWDVTYPLSVEKLKRAAQEIVGEHDFSPFCVVSSRKKNNNCNIYNARWRQVGKLLVFEIRGNRFLHNMVRSLVGAMVNLACENPDKNKLNLTLDRFADIIKAPSEARATFTAPPQGLYLVSVNYEKGTGI